MENNPSQMHTGGDMMPPSQKPGKGAVIALVIVIILAIAAVGGTWYYMNNKAKNDKKAQDAQIQQLQKQVDDLKKQSSAASETADWLTYTDAYDKLSFKYPKDWKLTTTEYTSEMKAQVPEWKGPFTQVKLVSPGGFVIGLNNHISGIGGGCDVCPNNNLIDSNKSLLLSNGVQLYLVKYEIRDKDSNKLLSRKIGFIGQKDGSPKIESYNGFPPYFIFESPGVDGAGTSFAGPGAMVGNGSNSDINYRPDLSAEQYFAQPDLQTADKIFKSIKQI